MIQPSNSSRHGFIIGPAMILIVLFVLWPSLRIVVSPNSAPVQPVVNLLGNVVTKPQPDTFLIGGRDFEPARDPILCTIKGGGYFEVFIPKANPGYTSLYVHGWQNGIGAARIVVKNEATTQEHVLRTNPSLAHRSFDVTHLITPGKPFRVIVQSLAGPSGLTYLSGLFIGNASQIPFFPPLATAMIGLACLFFLNDTFQKTNQKKLNTLLITGFFFTMLILGLRDQIQFFSQPWYWISFFALLIFYRRRENRTNDRFKIWTHEPLLLIFFVAFSVRWVGASGYGGVPIGFVNEAKSYCELAKRFNWHHPFSTEFREPVMVWIQYFVLKFFGWSDLHFRLSVATISCFGAVLTQTFSRRLFQNDLAAFTSGLLMAAGSFVSHSSLRADRYDVYVFLMLLFAIFALHDSQTWLFEFFLGGIAGLVCLLWFVGFIPVIGLGISRMIRYKKGFRQWLSYFLPMIFLVGFHLLYQFKRTGDPLFELNTTTAFFEKAVSTNESHATNFWAMISHVDLFSMTRNLIVGWFELFLNPNSNYVRSFLGFHYNTPYSLILYPFYLLGLITLFVQKRFLFWVFPLFFLNGMPMFLAVSHPRYYLHAAPYVAILLGVGIEEARRLAVKKFPSSI